MDPPSGDSHEAEQMVVDTVETVRIEDLPLEKKLEALKKHNFYDNYNEGRFIDAQDSVNTWCLSQIVEVDQRMLKVHFDGWSSKWDVVSISGESDQMSSHSRLTTTNWRLFVSTPADTRGRLRWLYDRL